MDFEWVAGLAIANEVLAFELVLSDCLEAVLEVGDVLNWLEIPCDGVLVDVHPAKDHERDENDRHQRHGDFDVGNE